MTHNKLISDEETWANRVCGMHVNVARELRGKKDDREFLQQIYDSIKATLNVPTASIGVAFTGPFRDYIHTWEGAFGDHNFDLVMCFLSDYTDIDSKQMTFIRIGSSLDASEPSPTWGTLYKVDYTQ